MTKLERDQDLVRRAIALALRGRSHVEPNPCVGAVALQGGDVVGEGYHRSFGEAHAERDALRDARERGASPDEIIVTMEPCSTQKGVAGKKTDPCTDAILGSGIRRVVIGGGDPDPRHDGPGTRLLRQRGIEVVTGVLENECRAINRRFERFLQSDRPWTILKTAQTLDGKIATRTGDSRWISGEFSRLEVHELRARCDAVIVGYRTAKADDPQLNVRLPEGHRLAAEQPLRVVIDPLADLPTSLKVIQTAGEHATLFVVRDDASPGRLKALESFGAELLRVSPGESERGLDLGEAWSALGARGLRRVLLEGGGGLAAGCLDRELIDQWRIYVAPKIVGGLDAPSAIGGVGCERLSDAAAFADLVSRTCGEDLVIDAFAV
ncbi:MAG: bifunctional diaminohydroxyphosphoribosylaminopyrimidine deaminase/5-amino-6-(5-phosphoribosylamino)uracil reductase RibD [Planctomycetota bacterium]